MGIEMLLVVVVAVVLSGCFHPSDRSGFFGISDGGWVSE